MLDIEEMSPATPSETLPSVDFICAISELLETEPDDLLAELGYIYPRTQQQDL
jgi:hypothetical protein